MEKSKVVSISDALPTVTIAKGGKKNEYVMVHERVKHFRELFPKGSILTELINSDDPLEIICKATIVNDGTILGVGHASELKGDGFINKTSALENAETSAVGRALGNIGIGINLGFASADEIVNATAKQEEKVDLSKEAIAKARKSLEDAHAKDADALREAFYALHEKMQDKLRDVANELRSSKG